MNNLKFLIIKWLLLDMMLPNLLYNYSILKSMILKKEKSYESDPFNQIMHKNVFTL